MTKQKLYKTYQEAQLDNLDCQIYETLTLGGKRFTTGRVSFSNSVLVGYVIPNELCDHKKYCMSIKDFLDKGYKFQDGDYCIDEGVPCKVEVVRNPYVNTFVEGDENRYILKAKALEKSKNKTKEINMNKKTHTFSKVTTIFEVNKEDMQEGIYGYQYKGIFYPCTDEVSLVNTLTRDTLVKKDEITWQQQVFDFVLKNSETDSKVKWWEHNELLEVNAIMSKQQWIEFSKLLEEY